MAGVHQNQNSFIVAAQPDRNAVVVLGKTRFGKLQLQFGENLRRGRDGRGVLADVASHFQQNAVNLGLFLVEQAH